MNVSILEDQGKYLIELEYNERVNNCEGRSCGKGKSNGEDSSEQRCFVPGDNCHCF